MDPIARDQRRGGEIAPPGGSHPAGFDFSPTFVYTPPMLARVYSCAVIGLDGVVVEVEVDYTSGFPAWISSDCRMQPCRKAASGCRRPLRMPVCLIRAAAGGQPGPSLGPQRRSNL